MPGSNLLHEIVRALAGAEDCAPHELEYALHDHVDTTAIERLAVMETVQWSLAFEVPGHDVEVHSDGRIVVDESVVRRERVSVYES